MSGSTFFPLLNPGQHVLHPFLPFSEQTKTRPARAGFSGSLTKSDGSSALSDRRSFHTVFSLHDSPERVLEFVPFCQHLLPGSGICRGFRIHHLLFQCRKQCVLLCCQRILIQYRLIQQGGRPLLFHCRHHLRCDVLSPYPLPPYGLPSCPLHRNLAVMLSLHVFTSSSVPAATILPPSLPPPGPISRR